MSKTASGIETLGRIAQECQTTFELDQDYDYYTDKTIDIYVFNNDRFIDLDNCLDSAVHYQEVYELKRKSTARMFDIKKLDERNHKLLEIQAALELGHKEQAKRIRVLEDNIEESRQEVIKLLSCISGERKTIAGEKKTIRSLRSQLGHAKRKLKELS